MAKNPWTPSARTREPAELMKPVHEAGCWYPQDLVGTDAWVYRLNDQEIADIFAAVAAVEASGAELRDVGKDEFPLPVFGPALADIREEVLNGRGIAVIRGLPIENRSRFQTAAAFWGIGRHMGKPLSQNARGHLLAHVKDMGGDIDSPTGRGYNSPSALGFHADQAEMLSLCMLHGAKSGGEHRVCSSVAVYNTMLERRPDLVKELTFRFYRTLRGEQPPGQTRLWARQPIFSVQDGYFAARGASSTIKRAQRIEGVPKLTSAQQEAIDMYQAVARELALEIHFEPGDIYYVCNHTALHARTHYEDWPEPERKRHLLRLWLNTEGVRPLNPEVWEGMQGIKGKFKEFTTPLDAS